MLDAAAPAGLIEKSGPLDEALALIQAAPAYTCLYRQQNQLAEYRCCMRQAGHLIFAQTGRLDYITNIIAVAFLGLFWKAGLARLVQSGGSRRTTFPML